MHDTDGDGDADATGTIGTATQVGGTDDLGNYVADAGDLTLNADGTYDFEPATGFAGNVVIPYETCDDGTPQACEEATLVITVLDVQRDYGDAPGMYPDAWHRKMTDSDDNNVLDGATDVWLGTNTDFEISQASSVSADGDTNDDAMTFGSGAGQFPLAIEPGQSFNVDITVNSSVADDVYYGMWIDWDEDGTYDNFYSGSQVTASPATATISVTAPMTTGATTINVRLRADDEPLVSADFQGGKSNGEVEDYQAAVVLPVDLVSFTAITEDCEVQLKWASASEENFSHYEVQRSTDGVRFQTIEILEGIGNISSIQYYEYKDAPEEGLNYYRLKMVDTDGTFAYSSIVTKRIDCASDSDIIVYPNPVGIHRGVLNLKLVSGQAEVQLQLTNTLGQVVGEMTLQLEPDIENILELDISNLPIGSYWIQVVGEQRATMFIIQE